MDLAAEVLARYHIAVSPRFVERVSLASGGSTNAEAIYQRALHENLKDITDSGTLPYGISSQASATISTSLVLQINSSRDATQPLRPLADTSEDDAALNAALQRCTETRLLRLILSDGHAELPALELTTLRAFRGIPVPGEKLLVRAGAEVRHGALLLSEDTVEPLGGEVQQLRREFLARRSRREVPYQTSTGLGDAPRFEPLVFGGKPHALGGADDEMAFRAAGNGGRGSFRGARGRGHHRGRGRGRG